MAKTQEPSPGSKPVLSTTPLPDDYVATLERIKAEVRSARLRAHVAVNTELVRLYWHIGQVIVERQQAAGWGTKVIGRLAADLRSAFPDMRGLSRSNLEYMRRFALALPGSEFPQQPVGEIPWGHITVLLDKLPDPDARSWYAAQTVRNGWSRAVLLNQIKARTMERAGAAPSNFTHTLPEPDSELAQQLTKDPYNLEFLGLTGQVAERQLETNLIDELHKFLLELGHGFAFVARQYHFNVDADDFYIDLLFYNFVQHRFVVIELKVDKFQPSYTGQLGYYVQYVEQNLRRPGDGSTVGILLCAERNEAVVRYSLAAASQALAVSTYTYDNLPVAEKQALPAAAEISEALGRAIEPGYQYTIEDELAARERPPERAPRPQ